MCYYINVQFQGQRFKTPQFFKRVCISRERRLASLSCLSVRPSVRVCRICSYWTIFYNYWPLMKGPIGCPETSSGNCHCSLYRNSAEERSSILFRGGSLKSRIFMKFDIGDFYENPLRNSKFGSKRTKLSKSLRADLDIFSLLTALRNIP